MIFAWPLPWIFPFATMHEHGLTRAKYLKDHKIMHKAFVKACDNGDMSQTLQRLVDARKISPANLQKYLDAGLVLLAKASTPRQLSDKTAPIRYRVEVLVLTERFQELRQVARDVRASNAKVLHA